MCIVNHVLKYRIMCATKHFAAVEFREHSEQYMPS